MKPWLALIAFPLIAAPQPEHCGVPTLTLRVYDLAGLRKSDLAEALIQTARIFSAAAVDLSWTAGDPAAPEAHLLDLSVPTTTLAAPSRVIVARIIHERTRGFPPEALGWSLPAAQTGAHVTIFLDEIKRRQAEVGMAVPCLLGYALAHELGHVLMGSSAHAPRGLMRAEWGRTELDRIQHGALKFSESEATAIRTSLLAANNGLGPISSRVSDELLRIGPAGLRAQSDAIRQPGGRKK